MSSHPNVREEQLAPGPLAPRRARAVVRELLLDTDPRIAERALLVTSEIVTNAVIHAATPVRLDAMVDDGVLRVVVEDGDLRMPVTCHDAGPQGGFGLHIVEELAGAWGVVPRAHGKAVWFEFALVPAGAISGFGSDLETALG